MPLVHLTDLISKPDNTYAIGAFNVSDMEMAMGAIKAAEELHAPLILQIATEQECLLPCQIGRAHV